MGDRIFHLPGPGGRRPGFRRKALASIIESVRGGGTRDTRVRCDGCGRIRHFDSDWIGRVTESCRCGVFWQTPDDPGPMVRHYDQGILALEDVRAAIARAGAAPNPQHSAAGRQNRQKMTRLQTDFRARRST